MALNRVKGVRKRPSCPTRNTLNFSRFFFHPLYVTPCTLGRYWTRDEGEERKGRKGAKRRGSRHRARDKREARKGARWDREQSVIRDYGRAWVCLWKVHLDAALLGKYSGSNGPLNHIILFLEEWERERMREEQQGFTAFEQKASCSRILPRELLENNRPPPANLLLVTAAPWRLRNICLRAKVHIDVHSKSYFFFRERLNECSSDDSGMGPCDSKNGYAIDINSGNRRLEFLHGYNKNFIPTGVSFSLILLKLYVSSSGMELKNWKVCAPDWKSTFPVLVPEISWKIYSLVIAANLEYRISCQSFHIPINSLRIKLFAVFFKSDKSEPWKLCIFLILTSRFRMKFSCNDSKRESRMRRNPRW